SVDGRSYQLSSVRADDAYSRHGGNANERAAGQGLRQFALHAPADAAPLFQALDFSAADGSEIGRTLGQISPQGYSASLGASLLREREVMETVLRGMKDGMRDGDEQWRGFAIGFGGKSRQDSRSPTMGYRASTYGLVIGGGKRLSSQPDVTVGL